MREKLLRGKILVDVSSLKATFPDILYRRAKLSSYCTIGCGGYADFLYPSTEEQLLSLLYFCKREGIRYFFLSGGSNVLPCDGIFDGIIISFKLLKGISLSGDELTVNAGERFSSIIKYSMHNGISCCEFMTGIPALVGGSVFMNAGVGSECLSSIIRRVYATDGNRVYCLDNSRCRFSNKSSVFQRNGMAIIKASFSIVEEKREIISEKISYYKNRRKHLPLGRSMGCVFKNDGSVSSGMLIDECGLKGVRIGGACVSDAHANFIINDNNARSRDVLSLIAYVKEEVFKKTGINLLREIQILT